MLSADLFGGLGGQNPPQGKQIISPNCCVAVQALSGGAPTGGEGGEGRELTYFRYFRSPPPPPPSNKEEKQITHAILCVVEDFKCQAHTGGIELSICKDVQLSSTFCYVNPKCYYQNGRRSLEHVAIHSSLGQILTQQFLGIPD